MNKRYSQGGYVVVLNTLIFVVIASFVVYAISYPLLSTNRAVDQLLHSKRAFIVSESATNETLYKIKNNISVPNSDTLELGGIEAHTNLTSGFGGRTIKTTATDLDVTRIIEVDLAESSGVSFNYGMQTGQGGFELNGGTKINGNVYSNGNILGFGGATITGSAIVASSPGRLGEINGQQYDQLTVTGDVWAHKISGVHANGIIYCQTSSYVNKGCNTSRPDPVEQPFPISDSEIESWKEAASLGVIKNGNVTVGPWPDQKVTMGVTKINGNLKVNSGGSLTMSGTLWVTGDLNIESGGIYLASTMGADSGIIVVDGKVNITGGGHIEGNGIPGNYILVVTTSSCPTGPNCNGQNAITLSGGAGSVIVNAQKGTARLTGGAQVNQLTANKVIMDGGTGVDYKTGLIDMNFNSGPSGSWRVSQWKEI